MKVILGFLRNGPSTIWMSTEYNHLKHALIFYPHLFYHISTNLYKPYLQSMPTYSLCLTSFFIIKWLRLRHALEITNPWY